jgi:hypothetical protein
MSAFVPKVDISAPQVISVLHPIADIRRSGWDVREVPIADIRDKGPSAARWKIAVGQQLLATLLVFPFATFWNRASSEDADAPGCFSIKSSISFSAASMVLELSWFMVSTSYIQGGVHPLYVANCGYLPLFNR